MGTQFDFAGLALGGTETIETPLGDITCPEGASRITGISAACALETGTATEGFLGRAKISFSGSGEIEGIPVHLSSIIDVGQMPGYPEFIPVNISCKELTRIHTYMTLSQAQTGACYGQICLRFE